MVEDGITISQTMLNSLGILCFGSGLTFLSAWFWHGKNVAETKAAAIAADHALVLLRVAELEIKQRLSDQATTPIITAFQGLLAKQLTHVGTPEMDALLVKLGPPDVLTADERARLLVLLHERTTDHSIEITASEREAAKIMPAVMVMAADEQARFAGAGGVQDLKLITIVAVVASPPVEEPKTIQRDS